MTKVILASRTVPCLPIEYGVKTAEDLIGYHARNSNPAGQRSQTPESVQGLIQYCIEQGHWSIMEMAGMCVQVDTTRDVAAQIIRHKSLAFQEFSQRYADAGLLTSSLAVDIINGFEPRLQDTKNRQNSLAIASPYKSMAFKAIAAISIQTSVWAYNLLLRLGVAKEVTRRILPMSTPTRISINGNVRDFFFYLFVRNDLATQKEHREVAEAIEEIFKAEFPIVHKCLENYRLVDESKTQAWRHIKKARKSGKKVTGWKVTPKYEE